MSPEVKQRVQIALAAAIALAGIRAGYILYERHQEAQNEQHTAQAGALQPDYYVIPKKLYPYDVKSAKQLTQQPVWVKEGYRYTYYPYDAAQKRTDFSHEAGVLLPIEKLQINDVVTDVTPGGGGQRQVMALFTKEGRHYAVPIGTLKDGNFQIYSDEMLFIQDPHELYRHWPAEIWKAVDDHEMKPGMNELQATFAIGMGVPESSGDASLRVVKYPNGGKPLVITYTNGKATDIKPAS